MMIPRSLEHLAAARNDASGRPGWIRRAWSLRAPRRHAPLLTAALALVVFASAGCEDPLNKMNRDSRLVPYEPSEFFENRQSARPTVEGTVARGQAGQDQHLLTGRVNGEPATEFPYPITAEILDRGQSQFNIYCAVCHNATGDGNGMIVRRGFVPPPSFVYLDSRPLTEHEQWLQDVPPGHVFDVITNGFGAMFPHRDRVKIEDRWAIAAYVKALQLSRHADPNLLSSERPTAPQAVNE